jgi:hypothetical protein
VNRGNEASPGVQVAEESGERRQYVVRDAVTGEPWKTYPYSLAALLEALDDARLRSYSEGPVQVVRVIGDEEIAFRRYDQGQEVPPPLKTPGGCRARASRARQPLIVAGRQGPAF